MALYIPKDYRPQLVPETMEQAIKMLKTVFQEELSKQLNLRRVTAPLFVLAGTGINDDLNGVEHAVSFPVKSLGGHRAEVVHSLAKWKRMKLGAYGIPPRYGLYTDMNAIRCDEDLDNLHSIYVDQWDWEQTITVKDRNLEFLKSTVRKIYEAMKHMEQIVYRAYSHIYPILPDEITFIHTEDLLKDYPDLTSRQRETEAAKKYGAIFLTGIGGPLAHGEIHDGRAPDYDDWTTPTTDGHRGLNGDIIFWNPVLDSAIEMSSMGIRVDRESLLEQLRMRGCEERKELDFHKSLLDGEFPLSIGGGIGQSRLCMFFLRTAHIGEVQSSVWPDEMIELCRKNNIYLK
ncbi:MAG TPA: aspartate--ammonia ligase [Bacteroidales bacterium]|nr:aspartate--ammonia ligase [Bacteroidales bacterium]HPJ58360.1 aspartate--ammonia ligase [Bacteroidales bacterium]HPR10834.1 aspartate--ammonia ligase [Bacteroidales bacterium]HRW84206.1 aspartate--ammonia ligase [Bacteroidales bacterium]